MKLTDRFGRQINYLRISITDNCNLKCRYCSPPFSGRCHLDRSEILSYEELKTVAEAAVAAGISKIRITGGEPLVRKGVVEFCRMVSAIKGLETLALSTNGVRLKEMAAALNKAGVGRINISLDTLDRDRYIQITGKDHLNDVLAGIEAAKKAGFAPIKINTVVIRGVNEDEVNDLAAMTYQKPYHIRFIELMPFQNAGSGDFISLFVPVREIMEKIPGMETVRIGLSLNNPGPARLCRLPGAVGKVGFIAPMSWHFCDSCNRLRLTADGKIRSCLFSNTEIDIKTPLRNGALTKELAEIFRHAAHTKPRKHNFLSNPVYPESGRAMYAIGG